ncbi:MAG: hypothetical protein ABH840_01245 [Nanoarchaeota archaeon]
MKNNLSILLAGILAASSAACTNLGDKVEWQRLAISVKIEDKNMKRVYTLCKDYLCEFYFGKKDIEGYVDFVKKYSGELRGNIEHYGGGERGKKVVADGYVRLHQMCLDVAVSKLDSEVSENDFDELARGLVDNQKKGDVKSPVNYDDKAVFEGYKAYGKQRVDFFKALVRGNLGKNAKNSSDLVRNAFTKNEFGDYVEDEAKARAKLYSGFATSMKGSKNGFVRMFGAGIAMMTKQKSDEFSLKWVEIFFEKSEKEK